MSLKKALLSIDFDQAGYKRIVVSIGLDEKCFASGDPQADWRDATTYCINLIGRQMIKGVTRGLSCELFPEMHPEWQFDDNFMLVRISVGGKS